MLLDKWNLDDDEPAMAKKPKPRTANPDLGAGHPVWNLVERVPLIARALLLHLQIAVGVPIVLLIGTTMYESRFLPEILVASCPVGFAIGVRSYFRSVAIYRYERENADRFNLGATATPEPQPWIIIIWTLALPGVLFLGSALVLWSSTRFMAAAIPSATTGLAFWYWGSEPIRFYEQYLLSQPEMPTNAKTDEVLPATMPELPVLAVVLMGVVSIPIIASNSIAVFSVAFGLAAYCFVKLKPIWEMERNWSAVIYFLRFAFRVCQRFVSYPDAVETGRRLADFDQWAPPQTQWHRQVVFYGLLGLLYLTLIIGLSYYCPWEVFAKICVDVPALEVPFPNVVQEGYGWLFLPFLLIPLADPLAVYLFCFVFAIAGFLFFPPMILLAAYFPRLLTLERLRQRLKARRAAEHQ